jgi:putative GTP pyrophosphokinase
MATKKIKKAEERNIDRLVQLYVDSRDKVDLALGQLRTAVEGNKQLRLLYHSLKWRSKDPAHLKDKLLRKLQKSINGGEEFDIGDKNLFARINDLAGLRILHLYTHQTEQIDRYLKQVLDDVSFPLLEGPIAKTWDNESRGYFKSIGFTTEESETLYTSVHYVVQTNFRNPITCEIQVRTLMEEVWGEVDHSINYPHPTDIIACREQIAALARVTSGCTRLVDSIFRSHDAHKEITAKKR